MGFIKTLLIIIIVWYLLGYIVKLLFPSIMKWVAKRFENKYGGGNTQQQQQYDPTEDGKVTVTKKKETTKSPTTKDKIGDIEEVEFEEID